jgi:phosphoribosylaminoimidazolecarboxamide formyltransferase/IMP cyclohydrolase
MNRSTEVKKVERALVSVSNKEGVVEFARKLHEMGVEIISTGGTAKLLRESGIPVTNVSDYTGSPEILDGRVKSLHPKIHGALLGLRDNPLHQREMEEHGIKPIDLVVVNLYPFEQTVSQEDVTLEQAIENIDIGGPSMIRSGAKNYQDVAVVVTPARYGDVLEDLRANDGAISNDLRLALAVEAFERTAHYDSIIYTFLASLQKKKQPAAVSKLSLEYLKVMDLRYGENPHQKAALYREKIISEPCIPAAELLHGKELSFNNILDLDAACELVKEFSEPTAVIIKHTNPCGVAIGSSIFEAYKKARATDPVSAFGGVVAFNKSIDLETADELNKTFLEAILAPGYNSDALELLKTKTQRRLVLLEGLETWRMVGGTTLPGRDLRKIVGGILAQDRDLLTVAEKDLRCVTKRSPTEEEMKALLFAWRVAKHVKSNAIVYTTATETLGIGAGQMSRVDSSRIAVMKAQKPLKGSVVASDAFFPFRDGVDAAVEAGATAIIQPGGSVRDEESIQACDEHNVAMVFTGIRHFRH